MPPSDYDEISPDGVVYDGPPGGLEALLSSKRIESEIVTVEHGGESKTIKFRELSNDQKQACMAFAIQHVEDRRRTQEEDGKGEWRDAESNRDVLIGEEQHLRMLQAAMLDPETNGPACSLGWLRKRLGTRLFTKLGDRYEVFEQSIDPDYVTEDMVKMVIDDVKKNTPLDLLLMQYGSILLARSLQFSVLHLSNSETGKSSGLSTSAKPRSKQRKKRVTKSRAKPRRR
ncbi:MAG: hypothetical protein V3W44_10710 [Dehalococcoidales bacterium]